MEEAIIRTLPVKLTEEQQLEIGLMIAGNEIDIGRLEAEKSAMTKEYNDEIKGKWKENLDLSRTLKAGTKEEQVDCYWSTDDPEDGKKTLYRTDTSEKLETESMDLFDGGKEDEEKQEETEPVPDEKQ